MPRIASVRTHAVGITPKTNWLFVEVAGDDGISGFGEASLNGWERVLLAYAEQARASIEGRDSEAIGELSRYVPHSPGGLVAHAYTSAVEQALSDLAARRAGQPLHAWLGGARRTHVPAYANINRGTADRSPQGCAASALRAVAAGFRAVKIAPFDGVISQDRESTPFAQRMAAGIERVLAIREAVGPGIDLMVDCHWRFDEASAATLIDALAPAQLYWLECPISEHPACHAAIARLRARANARGMRLAGAETVPGLDAVQPMLAAGLYDAIMPDLKYCGGYRAMLAIAEAARRHGVQFSPHNPTGPICHLGSLQVCAVTESEPRVEFQLAESPLFVDLVHGCNPALRDGAFEVPQAPGVGATLDTALAASRPWMPLPANANLDPRLG